MATTTYSVNGMTCGHCTSAVTEELSKLDGVTEVTIDLNAGGTSAVHVTSESALDDTAVRAAVDEAGYELAAS
ncbi:heavy-metal-associated domain-containing protein [Kribbella sandramycini]|uniref:Copper chaperone CopZ n=1 Tax=Kribbella sandramycini TaxID=60450 RepID=A0A7Y4L1W6_9ACTN|nr:heavy-metal-associated domain-containing protein [Kribbella sandramycini]MBB6566518.1 copper chaperone CopZ [Kribbella sandramycini]NOL42825.1 heavy-metal-associated domain-containing protein [Kribbella sandramycini]